MADKADILRKLSAMQKLADDPSTNESFRLTILAKMAKWMEEYNVTLTDMDIREEGVGASTYRAEEKLSKQVHEIHYIVVAISDLTETRVSYIKSNQSYVFVGTETDRQYAEFLFRLCYHSIEQSWTAFRYSYDYAKLVRNQHGRAIRTTYRRGFASALAKRIFNLVEQKPKVAGNHLIVCKNALINAFTGKEGDGRKASKGIIIRDWTQGILETAVQEAGKVKLRNEVANNQTLYLEGK